MKRNCHFSVYFIVFLTIFRLSAIDSPPTDVLFPTMFDKIPPEFFLTFPIVVFSLCVHEFAHAIVADKGGDDTPRLQGRLTLSPLSHADLFGTIILPMFAVFSGLPLIGWARPVQINPMRLKSAKWLPWITAAGPLSNFAMAILATLIGKIIIMTAGYDAVNPVTFQVITYFIVINIGLGIFNLIPIPPLDGSKLLFYYVIQHYPKLFKAWDVMERYSFIFLYLFIIIKPTKYLLMLAIITLSSYFFQFLEG